MLPIRIAVGDVHLDGELNDSECARAVARVLPLTAEFQVWGDELHFDVPIPEPPRGRPDRSVRRGDLALWIEGRRLCVFFGPTPLSTAEEPVSAVPVTVVGTVRDADRLSGAKEAQTLTLSSTSGDTSSPDE